MKAWGRLLAAAGAALVMLALPAGASAAPRAHRRHVQVFPATNQGLMFVGEQGGYEIAVSFLEPDDAILHVGSYDNETGTFVSANYGAHFEGSLPFGRLRASFGAIGSLSVRFRPDGRGRLGRKSAKCTGRRGGEEYGQFVGRISLRGEGGYFAVHAHRLAGSLTRTFRLRCHVKRRRTIYPPESLREAVLPQLFLPGDGSLASLQVEAKEGGRVLGMRVDHFAGQREGATVELIEREYQGKMPVGRGAFIEASPPGTLLTSLPGEGPKRATFKPPAPFRGEAEYVAVSPTSHSWTGTLSVQLPGLLQPLTGPEFASSLCVARSFGSRTGCEFVAPNFQWAEE
ncbi:MAG: hypothetical protein JST59_12570 [Actinobacteria bacterium]|nr:hypothetical protein [Actinomycetota bacterium]